MIKKTMSLLLVCTMLIGLCSCWGKNNTKELQAVSVTKDGFDIKPVRFLENINTLAGEAVIEPTLQEFNSNNGLLQYAESQAYHGVRIAFCMQDGLEIPSVILIVSPPTDSKEGFETSDFNTLSLNALKALNVESAEFTLEAENTLHTWPAEQEEAYRWDGEHVTLTLERATEHGVFAITPKGVSAPEQWDFLIDSDTTGNSTGQPFSAGTYLVGEDLPAGTYDVAWVSGRGNCFAGIMIETFGEEEHTIKSYENLTLTDGEPIIISDTLTVTFTQQ